MMTQQLPITREDILKAFALESDEGRNVLKRYLAAYPQFAIDLVDLSRELSRQDLPDVELSEQDELSIQASLERYRNGRSMVSNLGKVPSKVFADAAGRLSLPLQVMIAFRERRVELASVPTRFLETLAAALQTTRGALESFLALPPQVSAGRTNKSGVRPSAAVKVPLGRVLLDAGVSPQRVSELLERAE
jgi:hypothetical protein